MPRTPRTTPSDYAELFEQYFDFIKHIVRRVGIVEPDVEDVASEILVKFMDKDYLSMYEEDRWFDTPSGRKRSRFQGFLASVVSKYALDHRDKQKTRARREPVRCEMPVRATGSSSPGLWIEVFGPTEEGGYEGVENALELEQVVRDARAVLAAEPIRGKRDLARVFGICVDQMQWEGKISRKKIAQEFGVSDTAVCHMFRDMRRVLRESGVFVPA